MNSLFSLYPSFLFNVSCCFVSGQVSLRARPTLTYKRGEVRGNADVLKRKFEDYCTPKNLVPLEYNPFFTCVQRSGENRETNTL